MTLPQRPKKVNRRTALDGTPLPIREEVRLRARRKTFEHLALLALALLVGIALVLLLPH